MKELTIDATLENVAAVTAFVDEQLEQLDCPMKTQMQVDIAIDELFGNIAHYAYNPEVGAATVRVEVTEIPRRRNNLYRQRRALRSACKSRSRHHPFRGGTADRRVGDIYGQEIYGRHFLRI